MTAPTLPGPAARGSRRRILLFLLVLLAGTGTACWRYRVTRPEYRLQQGTAALKAGDYDRATECADRLERAGETDRARLLRGEVLLALGEGTRALQLLGAIGPETPHRVRVAVSTGRALLATGRLRQAEGAFGFALSEDPNSTDALRGLAAVAYDLGQLHVAGERLERVAELDPADARPHRLIGLICRDLGKDEAAAEAYREALRRGPAPADDEAIRTELADVLVKLNAYAEALAVVDGGAGSSAEALVARAEALRGLGRGAEAAPALDARIARAPTAGLYRLRGLVHDDARQIADAARCYERALELDPADHRALYQLSITYAALERRADAARVAARLVAVQKDLDALSVLSIEAMSKPTDAGVRLKLAEACDRLGKPQLATMWRKAAAACAPAPGP